MVERAVCDASASTIWRWLHEDAIKPWQQRSWLFVRDPDFRAKAARVLDLYARRFEGRRLRPTSSSSAPTRSPSPRRSGCRHQTLPAGPGRRALVEFDYPGGGTLAYLAAWDVHHANRFGRVEAKTGIEPFGRLVEQVIGAEPTPRRGACSGSSTTAPATPAAPRSSASQAPCENLRLIHLPIHASKLNQIELYFSIVQRKALTPNDCEDLDAPTARLLAFEDHYRQIAQPFDWTFTRTDLDRVIDRTADREPELRLAA